MSDTLTDKINIEQRAIQIPSSYLVKGMFFSRLVDMLGDDWQRVQREVDKPPRLGRYIAFKDYPQADYLRVTGALAQKLYPRSAASEGLRRVARDDFALFASSTFGKVVLAVVGDAKSALLKMPTIYEKMAPGDWTVTASEIDERVVRLEFKPNYGTWHYQVGQIEGLICHFGQTPTITVSEPEKHHFRYDIQHGS